MTVITLVAIAAIAAVFYFVVWPLVQQTLVSQTCRTTYGADYSAQVYDGTAAPGSKIDANCFVASSKATDTGSQATVSKWKCCKVTSN